MSADETISHGRWRPQARESSFDQAKPRGRVVVRAAVRHGRFLARCRTSGRQPAAARRRPLRDRIDGRTGARAGGRLTCSCHKPNPGAVSCSVPDSVVWAVLTWPPCRARPSRGRLGRARRPRSRFFRHRTRERTTAAARRSARRAHNARFRTRRTSDRTATRTRHRQLLCFVLDVKQNGCVLCCCCCFQCPPANISSHLIHFPDPVSRAYFIFTHSQTVYKALSSTLV